MVGGAALSQLWLFIVAPILGAVVAGLVWMGIVGKEVERLE
jgi:aquaporin Z